MLTLWPLEDDGRTLEERIDAAIADMDFSERQAFFRKDIELMQYAHNYSPDKPGYRVSESRLLPYYEQYGAVA